jgi:CheY-like chemotaxis protein
VCIDSTDVAAVERAREDFCAAMRHEIRTPLNGLLGMLDTLLGGDLWPAQRDQALTALASARELAKLLTVHCGCPEEETRPLPRSPQGLHVLVVDDNRTNQMVVEAMLGLHGCTIHLAGDGEEAVRLMRDGLRCDLILMDIQMPVMDGVTAARCIRAMPGPASAVPIVALTAAVESTQQAACFADGMNGFVPKPIEHRVLLAAIVDATELKPYLQPMRISV